MKDSGKLILGSASPRRKEIMQLAGFKFDVQKANIDEVIEEGKIDNAIEHVAFQKARSLEQLNHGDGNWILTADTVVVLKGEIMGKPSGRSEAIDMLERLSGNQHQVITGVCLKQSGSKEMLFSDKTNVSFRKLRQSEIEFYVDHYNPFDKAGAYGIQEWIGLIGITSITGSYFNVMGLPVHKVYDQLVKSTGSLFLSK